MSADAAICRTSPYAVFRSVPGVKCGNGIPQPAWPACPEQGEWWIDGYGHLYCTRHAALRLRARAKLAGRLR